MIKKYYYCVWYVSAYQMHSREVITDYKLNDYSQINSLQDDIEITDNLTSVLITNWKLLRVTRVKEKVKA